MSPATRAPAPVDSTKNRRSPFLRDAAICFSFANVCDMRIWERLLGIHRLDAFYMQRYPGPSDYAAALIGVLLIAAVLFAVVSLCRRYLPPLPLRIATFLSFGLVLIPLNAARGLFRSQVSFLQELSLPHSVGVPAVLGVILAIALWKLQRRVAKAAALGCLVLFPFCVLTFGQSVWRLVGYHPEELRDLPSAPPLPNARTDIRVLWVIFDEWDYRLTFIDRPADVSMPAVDRLRPECITASNAHAPGGDTFVSLPALLTGRLLETDYRGPEFDLRQDDYLFHIPWDRTSNVFQTARQAGFNTALIGWYLPYSRMFNRSLTECLWWAKPTQGEMSGDTIPQKTLAQIRSLLETPLLSPFGQSSMTREQATMCQEFIPRAEATAVDPAMGFTVLHVPVPHAPHAYNRFTGRFDGKNKPYKGYFDSLVLLDRIVAGLRQELEQAHMWEKTVLVLSSDHPDRVSAKVDGKSDPRVPFFLKLPGNTTPAVYDKTFNTICTGNLLLAVARGEIKDADGAVKWLDMHATR
jgi:hypothetical protein